MPKNVLLYGNTVFIRLDTSVTFIDKSLKSVMDNTLYIAASVTGVVFPAAIHSYENIKKAHPDIREIDDLLSLREEWGK